MMMQASALLFVLENILVDPFMTDRNTFFRGKPQTDLLRAPVLSEQPSDIIPACVADAGTRFGISAFLSQMLSLFGSIATKTGVTGNLSADGRFMPFQYHCYLSLIKSCFQKDRNLVS